MGTGQSAHIAIQVGDQHHMTSMPPAPDFGTSGKKHLWRSTSLAMTALHVHTTDTDEEQDEEVDTCAVVFGGSSIGMCLPTHGVGPEVESRRVKVSIRMPPAGHGMHCSRV